MGVMASLIAAVFGFMAVVMLLPPWKGLAHRCLLRRAGRGVHPYRHHALEPQDARREETMIASISARKGRRGVMGEGDDVREEARALTREGKCWHCLHPVEGPPNPRYIRRIEALQVGPMGERDHPPIVFLGPDEIVAHGACHAVWGNAEEVPESPDELMDLYEDGGRRRERRGVMATEAAHTRTCPSRSRPRNRRCTPSDWGPLDLGTHAVVCHARDPVL